MVYEDRNDNQRFDMIPPGGNEAIDLLRSTDDGAFLEWVDGSDDDWSRNEYTPTLGLARGMNLVSRPHEGPGLNGPDCVLAPCGLVDGPCP